MFRTNVNRMREWKCCICLRRIEVNDYNQDLVLAIKSVHSKSDLHLTKILIKSSGNLDANIVKKTSGSSTDTTKKHLKPLENNFSSNNSSFMIDYEGVKN